MPEGDLAKSCEPSVLQWQSNRYVRACRSTRSGHSPTCVVVREGNQVLSSAWRRLGNTTLLLRLSLLRAASVIMGGFLCQGGRSCQPIDRWNAFFCAVSTEVATDAAEALFSQESTIPVVCNPAESRVGDPGDRPSSRINQQCSAALRGGPESVEQRGCDVHGRGHWPRMVEERACTNRDPLCDRRRADWRHGAGTIENTALVVSKAELFADRRAEVWSGRSSSPTLADSSSPPSWTRTAFFLFHTTTKRIQCLWTVVSLILCQKRCIHRIQNQEPPKAVGCTPPKRVWRAAAVTLTEYTTDDSKDETLHALGATLLHSLFVPVTTNLFFSLGGAPS